MSGPAAPTTPDPASFDDLPLAKRPAVLNAGGLDLSKRPLAKSRRGGHSDEEKGESSDAPESKRRKVESKGDSSDDDKPLSSLKATALPVKVKTEQLSSDDDKPLGALAKKAATATAAHGEDRSARARKPVTYKEVSSDDDDDLPLSKLKKEVKKERKPKAKSNSDDDDDDLPLSALKKKPTSNGSTSTSATTTMTTSTTAKAKTAVKKEASEDSDDVPLGVLAKKKASDKKGATPAKGKAVSKAKGAAKDSKKDVKKDTGDRSKKEKPVDEPVREYWKEEPLPEGQKWRTLSHMGPCFPPAYVPLPSHVKFYYDGQPMDLDPEHEEPAVWFATLLDHPYTKKPVFQKNFFDDWRAMLNEGRKKGDMHPVRRFELCDFTRIHRYIQDQSEKKKAMSKEEKKAIKVEKERLRQIHGYAMIDGFREPLGNFYIEPPGLFRGRGEHPKQGMIKKRVKPSEVTINISKDAPVPPCTLEGQRWGRIIHNNTVGWFACWKENINGNHKYVWPAAASAIKGRSDMEKYEVARRLVLNIDKIRRDYTANLSADDDSLRQMGTAMWLIDKLALRVGGEKDTENEADTVGCCSLRVEHVSFIDDATFTLKFDFLGKDSMRYENTVAVLPEVYRNMKSFCKHKRGEDNIFSHLSPPILNTHLKELMPGLTAKVFRTYNASITLESELSKTPPGITKLDELKLYYNRANREVAILCNHQRSVPKGHGDQVGKLTEMAATAQKELKEAEKDMKEAKKALKEAGKGDSRAQKAYDAALKKFEAKQMRASALQLKITDKEENKDIALGTSRINYMDPRITAAWCRKHGIAFDKIFAKTLVKKFSWAVQTPANFQFTPPADTVWPDNLSSSKKGRPSSRSGGKKSKKKADKKSGKTAGKKTASTKSKGSKKSKKGDDSEDDNDSDDGDDDDDDDDNDGGSGSSESEGEGDDEEEESEEAESSESSSSSSSGSSSSSSSSS